MSAPSNSVEQLDNVSFFKVGLELLLAGDLLGFLQKLQARRQHDGGVFVDLKLGGDIGNTIASLIRQLQPLNVKFWTSAESVPLAITLNSVKAARTARGSDPDSTAADGPMPIESGRAGSSTERGSIWVSTITSSVALES